MRTSLKTALRAVVLAGASLALAGGAEAQSRGHGGGYYRGGGGGGWHGAPWVWGGVGLGLGLGLASAYAWPYYGAPAYVYNPPAVVYAQPEVVTSPVPAYPDQGTTAQPVIYPRNGQSAAQMGADSDQCSQWAGHQPNATSDRSVFNRAIAACMDGRGYTLR